MAFVVVRGGVCHRLFSLVASKFLVVISALPILCLHVSYCFLQGLFVTFFLSGQGPSVCCFVLLNR